MEDETVQETVYIIDIESNDESIDPWFLDKNKELNMTKAVKAMIQETSRHNGFGASEEHNLE